jgi:cytochrome c-type biogenesis protein CcmH/NrfG
MPVLLLGLFFVAASVVVIFYFVRMKGMGGSQPDMADFKARLEEIRSRLKLGLVSESEADAERLALLAQIKTPRPQFVQYLQHLRGGAQTLPLSAAVFLFTAGLVATFAYFGSGSATAQPEVTGSQSGLESEVGAQLADYIRSTGIQQASSTTAPATETGELLPDVNVMIQRLETRLKASPDDVNGWQMLGWSYFNTGRFGDAANAFEKALQLNPGSTDIKASYEEAKAKASGSANTEAALPAQGSAGSGSAAVSGAGQHPAPGAMSALDSGDPIRGMVDRLAQRLESSPRDADGWIQLMRSRLVLGEEDVAQKALQKALEVFSDDPATKSRIASAAAGLGLKSP